MATRRGGGRSRSRSKGRGGLMGSVTGVVVFIALLGGLIAFMRIQDIHSISDFIDYSKTQSAKTDAWANRVAPLIDPDKVCDFVSNPSCLYLPVSEQKIGDVNDDGRIDELDVDAYKKKFGIVAGSKGEADKQVQEQGGQQRPDTGQQDAGQKEQQPQESALVQRIKSLTVADADGSDYSRGDYKHWVMQSGKCDTRETVLKNAGFRTTSTCKAVDGSASYKEPYTGKTVTDPRKLDIDHVIPLGYVNQHGGKKWSSAEKQQYANNWNGDSGKSTPVLLAVDSSANRQKGDKGPSEWMPSDKAYWCEYSTMWAGIASEYGISVTKADQNKLLEAAATCK